MTAVPPFRHHKRDLMGEVIQFSEAQLVSNLDGLKRLCAHLKIDIPDGPPVAIARRYLHWCNRHKQPRPDRR